MMSPLEIKILIYYMLLKSHFHRVFLDLFMIQYEMNPLVNKYLPFLITAVSKYWQNELSYALLTLYYVQSTSKSLLR